MPVPPPVDSGQRYPVALRDFLTYQNQPGGSDRFLVTPAPIGGGTISTDQTLDAAEVTKDLQTEILSMEQTIGAKPFMVPGNPTLGMSVQWLHSFLSPGKVDARNSIPPLPPPSHNHPHRYCLDLLSDDHPQYVPVNGSRGFNNPVTAPVATASGHLITLSQARSAGLNSTQVQNIINSSLAAAAQYTITGPTAGTYRFAGGVAQGYTDANGNLYVDLSPAGFSRLVTFVYMKMPFPGQSMLGWYAYQYMEDQLILLALSPQGAWIQFIEDIRVDRQALVCMCWMALGV